jgi:hypothetical protein
MARKAAKRLKNQGENQIEDQLDCGWAAVGDPKTLFWPKIKSIAEIGIRSSTDPTTCNRRLRMRAFASGLQSSGRFAVITEKLKELAAFSIPLALGLEMTWCAPSRFASSALDSLEVNGVTSQRHAFANLSPICYKLLIPTIRRGPWGSS